MFLEEIIDKLVELGREGIITVVGSMSSFMAYILSFLSLFYSRETLAFIGMLGFIIIFTSIFMIEDRRRKRRR